MPPVGDLRRALEASKATWKPAAALRDNDPVPRYPLGGATATFVRAADAPPVSWDEAMRTVPSNPGLIARRLELGLVPEELVEMAKAVLPTKLPSIELTTTEEKKPADTANVSAVEPAQGSTEKNQPAKAGRRTRKKGQR